MSSDYYKILQVAKNASESDIRKAYVIFSELFYLYDLLTLMAYQNCLLLLIYVKN